jgi:hypothetical protein
MKVLEISLLLAFDAYLPYLKFSERHSIFLLCVSHEISVVGAGWLCFIFICKIFYLFPLLVIKFFLLNFDLLLFSVVLGVSISLDHYLILLQLDHLKLFL